MSSGKKRCNFWLISGRFVRYLVFSGLANLWVVCGWFRVSQLTLNLSEFHINKISGYFILTSSCKIVRIHTNLCQKLEKKYFGVA